MSYRDENRSVLAVDCSCGGVGGGVVAGGKGGTNPSGSVPGYVVWDEGNLGTVSAQA